MALVWFVDKFPRSRKPVQYRRLEDLMALEANGRSISDDLGKQPSPVIPTRSKIWSCTNSENSKKCPFEVTKLQLLKMMIYDLIWPQVGNTGLHRMIYYQ